MEFIVFCIKECPILSALLVGLILFMCIFYWAKHREAYFDEKRGRMRKKFCFDASAKNELIKIVAGIVFMTIALVGCNRCLSGPSVGNKDFNEWTGEPRDKDPFNYYNRR